MLFVVVAHTLDFIVAFSVFISVLHYLVPAGTLAPPYHLNKATSTAYVVRGGSCSIGLDCGFTYVYLGNGSGTVHWGRGAALSFK